VPNFGLLEKRGGVIRFSPQTRSVWREFAGNAKRAGPTGFMTQTSDQIIARCRAIAGLSERQGCTTRTFLSPPMREVHGTLGDWMESLGMTVSVDAVGNLRGLYTGTQRESPRLLVGSHLDTVPNAGAFDGILGVVLGIALVESLGGRRLPFSIEIAGFSEEEGARFGVPFIGSRALVGTVDAALLERKDVHGCSVAEAIREFGLDPAAIPDAIVRGVYLGYLEFHIEQGPVLDGLNLPLGVVEGIAGQTQAHVSFRGRANHAGTTPMRMRHDALSAAAEWILAVEREALATPGLVATVGRMEAFPGASNVIAGEARASLDVRHADDAERSSAVARLLLTAREVAQRRGLAFDCVSQREQATVPCDAALTQAIEKAVARAGFPVQRIISGAGHDAMILGEKMPVTMLFLRSPAGISHHPDERVLSEDVAAALQTGLQFLELLEGSYA
jgi:allantoate deiminase